MNTGSIKDKSKKLNTNTCFHYFKIFLMIVKRAQNDDLITRNVFGKVRNIRKVETKINYLTEDEIKRLYNTPCKNLMVRKASFFAIYTGLRVSDILALEWNNIVRNADGTFSPLKQKNVDTGMGLERTICMFNGYKSVYECDLFARALEVISEFSGKNYGDDEATISAPPSKRSRWRRL